MTETVRTPGSPESAPDGAVGMPENAAAGAVDDWGGPGEPLPETEVETLAPEEAQVENAPASPAVDDWGGPGEPLPETQVETGAAEPEDAERDTAEPDAAEPDAAAPDAAEPDAAEPDLATPAVDDWGGPGEPLPESAVREAAETDGGATAAVLAPSPGSETSATSEPERHAPPQPRTVGRLVADALRAAGVRYAFTVPGESFLGLLEGLRDAGIRIVPTRHEGAAAFMAEAYGQLTGRPAACLATRAVGAANLAIGIHTARQNSTPLFVLIGQVERR